MRVAVVRSWEGSGMLQELTDDGQPCGPVQQVSDVVEAVRRRERAGPPPRWVWPCTAQVYPALLRAGVPLTRCHDLALTEAILLGHEGRWGEPRSLAAGWARLRGLAVPDDPPARPRELQATLFEPDPPPPAGAAHPLDAAVAVHADQLRRMSGAERPELMRLLVAAESSGALAAEEMGQQGMPWRADVHDALLTELLGSRPPPGIRSPRLRELAERIQEAFDGRAVNPDSPAEVVRAFGRVGIDIPSARSSVLRQVRHPAVPLMLEYKELSRLHAAHGWAWLDSWVRGARFRPEYVPGGVVSGRWATRGGGALQIPRAVRRAVIADPGWVLVVADAEQLEPRVLAALSGDRAMAEAAAAADLYAALAERAFGADRAKAKLAMLSAMYGGGDPAALAMLRHRFPAAVRYVEAAARTGEQGKVVRSRLGRTCPPPSRRWRELAGGSPTETADAAGPAMRAIRDRGRFTRNFVVQASAADWALVLLASLRRRLAELPDQAHLVFFQHDEVVVHCVQAAAELVVAAVHEAGEEARKLVFGDTTVRFPLGAAVVDCYADAKPG